MKNVRQVDLIARIRDALIDASVHLEPSLMEKLDWMRRETLQAVEALAPEDANYKPYKASLEVLDMIQENLRLAESHRLPMCQDTGMVVAFIEIGPDVPLSMFAIEEALHAGIADAVKDGSFRNSVVVEPVFDRVNTGTNLPPIIHWFPTEKPGLTFSMLLKGFGSENCSALAMLNPTAGPEGVVTAVAEIVQKAGGKPCPPIVVGVGLGGTAERAGLLSKRALTRKVGDAHPDPRYAQLEQQIFDKLQTLEIGPGGFGGPLTALGVAVEYEPTHIAGLPVAVSISCWADRKATFVWEGPYARN
ncbi:MAG: fumarate hydratase [Sphaerochaetaceae bacterium]|jgi:fumarate hydratase subunit alpha|nr:fumarate hydratase [Sphaerochaetaceae bacterium]MDD3365941.1 fumarate hydratase [Sphaerochaetaceae bacterium]MDD4218631.1 fumarate hydratase [Sphaerochaetaceae bacterium]MDY0371273.1 fumarate hydratase [Sphaerochaetaceae bacterium]